jgi:hypothetical protein
VAVAVSAKLCEQSYGEQIMTTGADKDFGWIEMHCKGRNLI